MTVLGECFLFTAVLSTAACLSTKAYDPQTLTILPSSPCDSAFCYDATVSRVGNISNDARASLRDVPGLYLIPAKDLLLQVVQPERCFTACLSKLNVSTNDAMEQYNIPNTATLNCSDNLSVFLCIATCIWHVNSNWTSFSTPQLGSENFDLYNPFKEIQLHKNRQLILMHLHMNDHEQAKKHNITFRKLSAILESLPPQPVCSDLCYVSEFGICATAFDGNIGKRQCVAACFNSTLCPAMCHDTADLAQEIIQADKAGAIPGPVHPPAVYLTDDWTIQTHSPALFYDISGEMTDTVINATTPIGLIWKVEPSNSTEVLYYATHFRHPFDQGSKSFYHLFTHYNHGGMAGYLRFVQFCQSANISYAFVNASGYSRFSPPTTVCFPGEYQPSPPQNMSIDASFNTHGLLEVNITIEHSPDHEHVQYYEISAVREEGHQLGVHCQEKKLFKLTLHKDEGLSIVMTGRGLQEYNFTSVWNCNVTFIVLVHPSTPNGTLNRYLESEKKVYRPKQMIASFLLQEIEIPHPQVVYAVHYTFNCTSGLANVTITGSVISNSSNASLNLEMFLNSLKAKLVKLDRLQQIQGEEEKQTINFTASNVEIVFNDVSPTSSGEKYNLTLLPGCCFIVNTKYRDSFTEKASDLVISPVAPSNIQNLTVLHYISETNTVNFSVSWLNSEFPHGNTSFNMLVATSNGTQILSNQTIFHRSNGKEAPVLPSQRFTTSKLLPIFKSGQFDFAVQAVSNWGARSAWLNTSVFVEYYSAEPIGLSAYIVGLPCAVGAVAAILLVVLIIACVCYYHKNKVVVISTSSLFVENAMTLDDGTDEAFPLQAMDSWELGPQDIIVLGQLGEGNFGEVYRGLVKFEADAPSTRYHSETIGDLLVAVKLLKSDATVALKSEFLREIALMKKVSGGVCPYVVNMVGCCTHQEPIALVLEYASNGDLLRYLRAMRKLCDEPEQVENGENENQYVNGPGTSAEDIPKDGDVLVADTDCPAIQQEATPANFISFGWQIASGMEYLSQLGIVHRDLACRNVLVCANNQLKVSDFGLAREDDCYVKTTEGKLPLRWMATESIQERVFTTKSDVWSFGVTLWEITTFGGHPYPSLGNRALLGYLLRGRKLEKPKNCSEEWYHLMSLCWALNPQNRPHFKELRVKLEEMLNSVHRAHYIDLNAGTDDMPYYPMSAAGAEDSFENDLPLELSNGQVQSPYLEPHSFTADCAGELERLSVGAAQVSSSTSSSVGEAMPAYTCCED